MKASLTTFFLWGFAIILTLPAEAQRGGGHTGGFSGRGGASGASRGFSGARGHGMSSRSVGVPSRPGGFSGRPFAPPVVLIRPPLRPRPIGRVISPGFNGAVRQSSPAPRPLWFNRPAERFPFRRFDHFNGFHHFHRGFGFPICSPVFGFGISFHHFGLFHQELDCFPRPFVSPFFFPFFPSVGPFFVVPPPVVFSPEPLAVPQQIEEAPTGESYTVSAESQPPGEPAQPEERAPRPLTLLQLKDGSMYGLTDYWLENGKLHYFTSYGGENSLPIERIDLDRTVQLNWERGVEFVLRPKPRTR